MIMTRDYNSLMISLIVSSNQFHRLECTIIAYKLVQSEGMPWLELVSFCCGIKLGLCSLPQLM